MNSGPLLYSSLAFGCGVLIAVQAATNASLIKHVESVPYSAVALFAAGFVALFIIAMASGSPPGRASWAAAPAWSYVGGVIVALYLLSITYLVPKIGVGPAIVLIVAGQILGATLIDGFGLFGVEMRLPSLQNLIGIGLIILGVALARNA